MNKNGENVLLLFSCYYFFFWGGGGGGGGILYLHHCSFEAYLLYCDIFVVIL